MPTGIAVPTKLQAPSSSSLGGGFSYQAQLVVDRQSVPVAGPPGITTLQLPSSPGSGYGFLIERISVTAGPLNAAPNNAVTARVYIGSASPQNEIDFTPAGGEDVSDENSPIYVPAGATFTVVWSGPGLEASTVCTMRVQYAVIQFVPATYGGS